MALENYKEWQSMQISLLFKCDSFIYRKNIFETYINSKDIDLWQIILNGDYLTFVKNIITQKDEPVPHDRQTDDMKKMISKNNNAKMVLCSI